MIHDPPLVRIQCRVPRPTSAQLEALRGTPTGFIVDALDGRAALQPEIKPVIPEAVVFCGVAVPCECGPADNLGVFVALPLVQPGDVLVAGTDGFRETAIVGDLVLGMARNQGAVAFVTDGCVRDVPGIREVGLPCFATGVTPNSPVKHGPATVNLPIVVGGVSVSPGDVVLGDVDGVVVVPFARIDAVIARLPEIRAAEATLVAKVKEGLRYPDWVADLHRGNRVQNLD